MSRIYQRILKKLKEREEQNNLRRLPEYNDSLIDFFSNDYLGLAKNTLLEKQIKDKVASLNTININGSTGSRLLSGNSEFAQQLEEKLAKRFKTEKVLLFNSGYNANLSILSAIPQKGDTIIYDELIHSSLKDGARLSFADRYSFAHNDVDDLKRKIGKASGEIFVVVEAVYSMDGDKAPIQEINQLCKETGANLIIDEAHSVGVYGEDGNGLAVELGEEVFATVYTFGKGPGVHGACITGKAELIDYLINFARPFIYTTALPIHSLVAIDETFQLISEEGEVRTKLHKNIQLFNEKIREAELENFTIASDSGIHVILVNGNEKVISVAEEIRKAGYDVRAIKSPTVKEGRECLRICLHAYNTSEEITGLVDTLKTLIG